MKRFVVYLMGVGWLAGAACQEKEQKIKLTSHLSAEPNETTVQPFLSFSAPVVFARYISHFAPSRLQASFYEADGANCVVSPLFTAPHMHSLTQTVDLCSPSPKLALVAESSSKSAKKRWLLPHPPQSFMWQQDLPQGGKTLILELVDRDGLPWPASAVTHQQDRLYTVRLVPTYPIPANRELFLVAFILDAYGKKQEIWLQPLWVIQSKEKIPSPPWCATASETSEPKPKKGKMYHRYARKV